MHLQLRTFFMGTLYTANQLVGCHQTYGTVEVIKTQLRCPNSFALHQCSTFNSSLRFDVKYYENESSRFSFCARQNANSSSAVDSAADCSHWLLLAVFVFLAFTAEERESRLVFFLLLRGFGVDTGQLGCGHWFWAFRRFRVSFQRCGRVDRGRCGGGVIRRRHAHRQRGRGRVRSSLAIGQRQLVTTATVVIHGRGCSLWSWYWSQLKHFAHTRTLNL